MNRNYDFTLKDILSDERIKEFLNCGEVKLKKCMNEIEKKYFEGKKIYHSRSAKENADFLFRFEVKGLLLLLLKLEIDDPFDKRAQKNGISSLNVDRMIHQLSTEEGISLLTDYEYKVLIQYCDPENLNDVSKLLEQMKKAITNLAVIYARKYDNFIPGLSQNILKTISEITEMIIGRSYLKDDLQIGPIISCNKEMTKLLPSSYINEIGLKDAVVMALNRIIRDIYYFDNNNVCYRKMRLPKKSGEYEEIYKDYKNLQAEYLDFNNLNQMEEKCWYYLFEKQAKCDDIFYLGDKNDEPLKWNCDPFFGYDYLLKPFEEEMLNSIYQKQIECEDYVADEEKILTYRNEMQSILKRNYNPISINGYLLDPSEEKMLNSIYQKQIECEDYVADEEKILTYRNEMQSILKRYYNQAFDLNPEVYEEYKYYDSEITSLENDFNQYAIGLYKLQMCICGNKVSNECSMQQCIQYRTKVENVIVGDVEFGKYLTTFEQEFFSLFVSVK